METKNFILPSVIKDHQTAFWTIVVSVGTVGVGCLAYKYKSMVNAKDKSQLHNNKTEKETESYVLKETAKTACKIMENATDLMPEMRKIKDQLNELKFNLNNNQWQQSPSQTSKEWKASSYEEMMTQTSVKFAPIAKGYVEKGLVNVMLGGAGVCKSLAMRQLARIAATGERCEFLPPDCEPSEKMDVLFYRMEEFPGEDERKYGKGRIFSDAGILWRTRSEIEVFTLQGLLDDIELFAKQATKDTLICIDPITKLKDYVHDKFIAGAERIQSLAPKGVILTFLISAHVEEIGDWKEITSEHIKGGDKLIQQAGSVFVVRKERRGGCYRYFQILKEPKGYALREDVVVCKITETVLDAENKYTYLTFVDEKSEVEARPLKPKVVPDSNKGDETKSREAEWLEQAIEIERMSEQISLTEVAKKLNISRPTVYKRLAFLNEWRSQKQDEAVSQSEGEE